MYHQILVENSFFRILLTRDDERRMGRAQLLGRQGRNPTYATAAAKTFEKGCNAGLVRNPSTFEASAAQGRSATSYITRRELRTSGLARLKARMLASRGTRALFIRSLSRNVSCRDSLPSVASSCGALARGLSGCTLDRSDRSLRGPACAR
jgi:hypothetical protein